MEKEKNDLAFPNIEEIKQPFAAQFSANLLLGIQMHQICAFMRDKFFMLCPTSAKYFLIKLPTIIAGVVTYLSKEKPGSIERERLSDALLRSVNRRASLLEEKSIDVKKIMSAYASSPQLQKKKQQAQIVEVFNDTGKEVAAQDSLKLVKLKDTSEVYQTIKKLELGVLWSQLSDRISSGKSDIYMIKSMAGELKQAAITWPEEADKGKKKTEEEVNKEKKKVEEIPLFMIEYNNETKSISYMRGQGDQLLSTSNYFFPQISTLLQTLVKKIATPNGKDKLPDYTKEVKEIRDVEALESSLSENTVLTVDGIKAIHLPEGKKGKGKKKMQVLNENDKIIASGRFVLTPEMFEDKDFVRNICNMPGIWVDFTQISTDQKKLVGNALCNIIDQTAGEVIYPKLTRAPVVYMPYAFNARLPIMKTAGSIRVPQAGILYTPNLEKVGKIVAHNVANFEAGILEEVEDKIYVAKDCKHNLPGEAKKKLAR